MIEIPSDSKAANYDPFRNYPVLPASCLPTDTPPECLKQLMSLLPHLPSTTTVSNIVSSYRDSAGNLVHGTPVVNRPWDWIENLGEPTVQETKDRDRDFIERERLKVKYLVKNSGSLSLETFGARMTDDGILRNIIRGSNPRLEDDLRTFEDGLSSEGVLKRDWRETRVVELDNESSVGRLKADIDHENGLPTQSGLKIEIRSTPRASPASSVVSRSSARGSASSRKHSPGQQSLGRLSEPMQVDPITNTSISRTAASKRKATAASTVSDDDIEIIEGPSQPRGGLSAKKSRASKSNSSKTKVKKR